MHTVHNMTSLEARGKRMQACTGTSALTGLIADGDTGTAWD